MNLAPNTTESARSKAASTEAKTSSPAYRPTQAQALGHMHLRCSPPPAWVAHIGPSRRAASNQNIAAARPVSQALRGGSVARWMSLLRDPQSWISAIAVLTLVGLSGGAFEADENQAERRVPHLHSGMTNDAVVAELSESRR